MRIQRSARPSNVCIRVSMLLLSILFLVGTTAFASPILHVESGVYLYGSSTYDVKDSVTTSSGLTLSRHFSTDFAYGPLGDQIKGDYSADAFASYGVLRGSISSGMGGNEGYPSISVYTLGFFQDTLTFNTGPGTTGTAYFTYTIHGTGSSGGGFPIGGEIQTQTWGGFLAGKSGTAHTVTYIDTTDKTVNVEIKSDPIPFVSGLPVPIDANLGPAIALNCVDFTIFHPCSLWGAFGTSDFGHTALLSGIELFDSLGKPITIFSIASESGTHYTGSGVAAVPEPGSVVLLGSGLAFIAKRGRRRNSRSGLPPKAS